MIVRARKTASPHFTRRLRVDVGERDNIEGERPCHVGERDNERKL